MFFGVLLAVAMGFATGAAVDNQYPIVGKTITQQEQAAPTVTKTTTTYKK